MYSKILIATDGSETAARAVALGASLVSDSGGAPILVHVGDEARGKAVLEQAVKQIPGARTISVTGDPADKILETAEIEGVDLIVIGNKGMAGAKRFLLGSVPNQISHNASCDVFIVKTT